MVPHPGQFSYCSWMVSQSWSVSLLFLDGVPILVMAPELQEDLLGTKVKKVLLSLIQNKELGATRDVTAPELQEVSLYQFI